ncbi:MAG: hypothetical protein GF329_00960 [Candidatus Lokiarchaeota archaeon]|nr:hypothetical protein [Candidatus Lokiarchaeota archaeon]
MIDHDRFKDAYNTYFEIVNELKKNPEIDDEFFNGGARSLRTNKHEKFQLHNLFKEIARNIKFHGKTLEDYPFINPKYHSQILKIRVRVPETQNPYYGY